ncbi:MAG: hypothetical protein ACK4XJ_11970 [Fimbriimonadaceae bacterium]
MDRARVRFTGVYSFSPRLQLGLEWNPVAREAGPIGNYLLLPESPTMPMISLGTSSDRIGSPAGKRAYYATLAKGFDKAGLNVFASLNYSEWDAAFNVPFGATWSIDPTWSLMAMNDGRKSHLLLTHRDGSVSVTGMLVWMKHPGVSIAIRY